MKDVDPKEPARVRAMFSGVARRYDLLNHLLSANLDRRWRRLAAQELPDDPGARLLDLCGGTGDFGLQALQARRAGWVVCCDFAHPMLAIADRKARRRELHDRFAILEADGLRLPVADGSFDAITIGFGIRNLADIPAGLEEMLRVLRPGGTLVVLEFSTPTGPVLSRLYGPYLKRLLPRAGDRISGKSGPYGYLARTIAAFPSPPQLAGIIRAAGFAACGWTALTGGIVAIHRAVKEAAPETTGSGA